MERRRLSSSLTFLFKFGFPLLWFTLFGVLGYFICFVPFDPRTGPPPGAAEAWVFFVGMGLGSLLVYRWFMRLRKVFLEGDSLIVVRGGREVHVPLSEVDWVSGTIGMSPDLVWVRFRHPTEAGSKIVFLPRMRVIAWSWPHPVVEELRKLVWQAAPGVDGQLR